MNKICELKLRYERLLPVDGISKTELNEIQTKLNVHLPEDFCEIALFYSGGLLGGISNYSFANSDGSTNIVDETISLRKSINLPSRFVALAEPAESLIVMDTQSTPSIIWLDAVEVNKLDSRSFLSEPDEWSTYADFFAQLLNDEEAGNGRMIPG